MADDDQLARAKWGDPEACLALGRAAELLGDLQAAYLQYHAGSRRDPALEGEARRLGDPIASRQRPALEALAASGCLVELADCQHFYDGRPTGWARRAALGGDTSRPVFELRLKECDDAQLERVADLDALAALEIQSGRVTDRGAAALHACASRASSCTAARSSRTRGSGA